MREQPTLGKTEIAGELAEADAGEPLAAGEPPGTFDNSFPRFFAFAHARDVNNTTGRAFSQAPRRSFWFE